MTVAWSAATGLISVVPTLPGGAAAPAFMLFMFRKAYGVGDYYPQLMTLLGTLPQMRGQMPFRRTQFFIRVVDINGAAYDSPAVEMDYSSSTLAGNVKYTEFHVPERSELGELSAAHAFSYDLKNGAGVSGTIANAIRPVFVPDGTLASVGAYTVASSKFFVSPTVFLSGNEGTRTHGPVLGYF